MPHANTKLYLYTQQQIAVSMRMTKFKNMCAVLNATEDMVEIEKSEKKRIKKDYNSNRSIKSKF